MNINDSVISQDGVLKATLTVFDPRTGQGRLKIEELKLRTTVSNLAASSVPRFISGSYLPIHFRR